MFNITFQIKIDGIELEQLNVKWLREQIGLVSQEPVLFGCTIRENVEYGRAGVTNEDIEDAIDKANAREFISKLPEVWKDEPYFSLKTWNSKNFYHMVFQSIIRSFILKNFKNPKMLKFSTQLILFTNSLLFRLRPRIGFRKKKHFRKRNPPWRARAFLSRLWHRQRVINPIYENDV